MDVMSYAEPSPDTKMIKMENVFEWLQKWYQSQCDGDWEHGKGIQIGTLSNQDRQDGPSVTMT
jgi:Immunity protein 53